MGPHRSLTGKVWGQTLALRNPEGIHGFDPMELSVFQKTDRFQIGPLMAHHQAFTVKVCVDTGTPRSQQGGLEGNPAKFSVLLKTSEFHSGPHMGPHRAVTGKVWGQTLALRNPEGIHGFMYCIVAVGPRCVLQQGACVGL